MTLNLPALTLCLTLAAGNAAALPAHRYNDDNRSLTAMPGGHADLLAFDGAASLLVAEPRQPEPAATPQPADATVTAKATATTTATTKATAAASAVPEPSGIAMLLCGLLLLLLGPAQHRDALFDAGRRRQRR